MGSGSGMSTQAIKLFQITPYVNDFQTLNNPGSWQAPRKISFTSRFWPKSFIPDDVKLAELSDPTTVLNERMWYLWGSKILWPPAYFQGVKTPKPHDLRSDFDDRGWLLRCLLKSFYSRKRTRIRRIRWNVSRLIFYRATLWVNVVLAVVRCSSVRHYTRVLYPNGYKDIKFFLIIILVFEPKRRWAQKEPVDGDDKWIIVGTEKFAIFCKYLAIA